MAVAASEATGALNLVASERLRRVERLMRT